MNTIINATGRDEKIANLQNNQGENMKLTDIERMNWRLYITSELGKVKDPRRRPLLLG